MASPILAPLNPQQREAVQQTEGPLLIIAGPGSGKTRVIAHRVAHLVADKNVSPRNILAVTFTNKAAREMRDRIFALVGQELGQDLTLGTFHAICARTLRIEGERIGVPRSFAIYDDADQIAAIKQAMGDLGLDEKRLAPRALLSAISRAKSELRGSAAFAALVSDYFQEVTARVYSRYQDILEANSALDFDDILLKTVRLFEEAEDVREKYSHRYRYVHIDEFQDTNVVQYVLAKQWSSHHRNICVVGDPDQSIYTWRAADIRNILDFERDFPQAKVIFLEQNYRSTQAILDSAHSVIVVNKQRKERNLWTDLGEGEPIVMHEAYDEEEEARFVAQEVERLTKESSLSPKDCAVMYRTNAQSRPLEEAFVRRSIPYRLVGGTRFYERREVKDLLAYLRVVHNPHDSVALMRVINTPARGIGDRTITEINRFARERGIPVYSALQLLAEAERDAPEKEIDVGVMPALQRRTLGSALRFLGIINQLMDVAKSASLSALLRALLDAIDYQQYLAADPEGEERLENVMELLVVAAQYDELAPEHALAAFLEDVALVTDIDQYDEAIEAVTLITLHAAKGLEFPVVFITGMEEGLLPHMRALEGGDPAELEEERRLCYVGMTRAKQALYLVRAFRRSFAGHRNPSRFLADIPPELIKSKQPTQAPNLWPSSRRSGPQGAGAPRRYRYAERGQEDDEDHSEAKSFAAGDHVSHPKFGEGIVVSAETSGGDQLVTVAFKGEAGIKKLLLTYAALERIES